MLFTCALLPVCLMFGDASISHTVNFFLENDADDENSPSDLGFGVKSLGLALVFAAIFAAIEVIFSMLCAMHNFDAVLSKGFLSSFAAIGTASCISFIVSPLFLAILRVRDAKNLDTSGFVLSLVSMILSFVICIAAIMCMGALGVLQ